MSSSASKIRLAGFDDLFGGEAVKKDIIEVPLGELHPFKGHPFRVADDENRAYIVYSIDNIMEDLGCSKPTCLKINRRTTNTFQQLNAGVFWIKGEGSL